MLRSKTPKLKAAKSKKRKASRSPSPPKNFQIQPEDEVVRHGFYDTGMVVGANLMHRQNANTEFAYVRIPGTRNFRLWAHDGLLPRPNFMYP